MKNGGGGSREGKDAIVEFRKGTPVHKHEKQVYMRWSVRLQTREGKLQIFLNYIYGHSDNNLGPLKY